MSLHIPSLAELRNVQVELARFQHRVFIMLLLNCSLQVCSCRLDTANFILATLLLLLLPGCWHLCLLLLKRSCKVITSKW